VFWLPETTFDWYFPPLPKTLGPCCSPEFTMIRACAVGLVLFCLAPLSWTQTQPNVANPAQTPKATTSKSSPKKNASRRNAPSTPIAAAETGPCRIGVIPAIGDQFVVKKVGLTVFGNELTEVPIEGWGLDDLAFARIRAAAGPGVAVRRLPYARGAFDALYHPAPALFHNTKDDLTALVRQIAGNSGCERIVLVLRGEKQLGGTNQILEGVGIINHDTKLLNRTNLFAYTRVTLLDGQTFAVRKTPSLTFGSLFEGAVSAVSGPHKELDNSLFPASPADAANSAALRDGTRALLVEYFDKTLPDLLRE
jgi:hypothetical protein